MQRMCSVVTVDGAALGPVRIMTTHLEYFSARQRMAQAGALRALQMQACALADAPEMSSDELLCTRKNWNRVILEGRKPGLTLGIGCETAQFPLPKVGKDLFRDLKRVAQTLDSIDGGEEYQKVCDELVACFDNQELTFSARILRSMIDEGIGGTGKALGEAYRNLLREEPLEILQEAEFIAETEASKRRQQEIEAADTEPFSVWLEKHA